MGLLTDVAVRMRRHYLSDPAWRVAVQTFLAMGWLRAAVSNTTTAGWWTGEAVARFLDDHATSGIGPYHSLMSDLVDQTAGSIALAVVAIEGMVAVLLVLNFRPRLGYALGAFLNLQFVMLGAVNPSVFYIMLTLVVIVCDVESVITTPAATRRLARTATVVAVAATGALIPAVKTLTPSKVVEDPALVLISVAGILTLAVWWIDLRTRHRHEELSATSWAEPSSVVRPSGRTPPISGRPVPEPRTVDAPPR